VRTHWAARAKAAKKYRHDCYLGAMAEGVRPGMYSGPLTLHVAFHPQDKRARDQDNLVAAMKSGFDGLADALGIDDKLFRLGEISIGTPKQRPCVVVRIVPMVVNIPIIGQIT
jgi:hypothetical protein